MKQTFDNLTEKYNKIIVSEEYKKLRQEFELADIVLLIGSGGNISISEHMSSDLSRHTGKSVFSPLSLADFTIRDPLMKIQNPYTRWIKKFVDLTDKKTIAIAISSSGSSESLNDALSYAKTKGCMTWVISGKNKCKDHSNIFIDVDYHHQNEVISIMLMYHLIDDLGYNLPKI